MTLLYYNSKKLKTIETIVNTELKKVAKWLGKGTPPKAFGTCGKYCFRSINEVRAGGTGP